MFTVTPDAAPEKSATFPDPLAENELPFGVPPTNLVFPASNPT
jgi:hypothetical protein